MNRLTSLLALALVCAAMPARAESPHVGATLPAALPHPFDEDADGPTQLKAALAEAKASGKRVLLDFGANWCPDCKILAGIMALDGVKSYLDAHYVVAMIDVGRFKKNLDLAAAYGVDVKGIPNVLVLDAGGKLINHSDTAVLTDARSMAPQAVVDDLVRWAESPGS